MAVKMRLARHGRKKFAFYHIVIANSRAPRDGRYIERIGSYNPNTDPATIDLDFEKALTWLENGAQPTDTVKAILSYRGVLYRKHLSGGVKKGSFSEEEAERRFESWLTEKENKIQAKKDRLIREADTNIKKQLEAETRVNERRVAAQTARNAARAKAAEAKKAAEEAATSSEGETESGNSPS